MDSEEKKAEFETIIDTYHNGEKFQLYGEIREFGVSNFVYALTDSEIEESKQKEILIALIHRMAEELEN